MITRHWCMCIDVCVCAKQVETIEPHEETIGACESKRWKGGGAADPNRYARYSRGPEFNVEQQRYNDQLTKNGRTEQTW